MPVESIGGGTLCTGKGIRVFQLLSLKGRLGLEGKGMKGPATKAVMAMYNIPGKATAKNRAIALQRIEAELKELEPKVKGGA